MIRNLAKSISTKTGAARLALGVVIGLIVLKVVVAIISRSISIYAQATDSFLDLFSIGITVIAVRMSATPADEEHPFGHSKMEGFAALIQAFLVLGAGVFIIYSAVQRIIHRTVIEPDAGMAVMIISIIASFLLSRHLRRVAKATGSTAIEASARNISADVYSATGVLVGLLAVRLTDLVILDPIIALIMAVFVLKAGYEVVIRAFRELTDYTLPKEEQEILHNCIREHFTQLVDFHEVRSRRAGSERFIDLHLVMPRYVSVEDAHDMCDHLEQDIKAKLPNANIVIHVEPCIENDCLRCAITICDLRTLKKKTSTR
ncbi:MAG: cation diffusion facilitator family transporter [Dehalococcoidales bacterium]|nr:cation diffusion facilitator family transporter [Dehalococcoidales bacterium]